MRSRPLALIAITAATIAVLPGGVSPAQAATKNCAKGSTLAIGKSARVFSVKKDGIRRVYGCATGSDKRSYLGRRGGEGVDISVLSVFGPRVGYVRSACAETGCQQTVYVHDLKNRKNLTTAPAAPEDAETKVTDIVLGSKGLVAWISQAGDPVTQRYLFASGPGGPLVPIASGLDIVSGSLALARKRLYWTQGTAQVVNLP